MFIYILSQDKISLKLLIQMECAESESMGFLSSLIGDGCECDGYSIRIVGHSLGGAIASLLGIRVCFQFTKVYIHLSFSTYLLCLTLFFFGV